VPLEHGLDRWWRRIGGRGDDGQRDDSEKNAGNESHRGGTSRARRCMK
jgi:hypothetical protein